MTVGGYGIESSQQQDAPANTGFTEKLSSQNNFCTAVTAGADELCRFTTHLEFQDIYSICCLGWQ